MRSEVAQAVVAPLAGMSELSTAAELLGEIWSTPKDQYPVTPELMRALSHAGGYVSGAWLGDRLVGVSVGFLGLDDGRPLLHSHISGVDPAHQGARIGYALKQHQRQWALDRGIDIIEWTFDPLVRRNAYFNLAKLGAVVTEFEADFYGPMHDGFNAGDETDRVVARWRITATQPEAIDSSGAPAILSVTDDGRPVADGSSAPVLRAWIPEDHIAMRDSDPARARDWRLAVRDTVGAALRRGYTATAMTRDGWYTLVKAAQ
jgi:predicted GNAT superfamily acetyltransferase